MGPSVKNVKYLSSIVFVCMREREGAWMCPCMHLTEKDVHPAIK